MQQAKNISVDSMSPIEYEKYVADRMKEWGYVNVRTTPSSGDFGADIIMGNKDGKRYCIQCKRHQNPVGYKAVQEIYSAKAYYNCDEVWVCSTNGFTKNAQEGAQRIGVKLFIIR